MRSDCNLYQGETVDVRYDPNQPGHADIASGGSQSTGAIVFIVIGVIFAAVGLVSTFRSGFGYVRIGSRTRAH